MTALQVNDNLLFVYGECGPHVTEEEFNKWYDEKHIPALLSTLSEYSTAARYKAADGKSPSWLAIYDLTTPEVIESEAYKALFTNAPDNEKSLISRLTVLHRSLYHRTLTVENPDFEDQSLPSKVVVAVGRQIKPEQEEEIDKWYSEEHLPLLSKVPGFIRARRYKFLSGEELAGKADPTSPVIPFSHLTVYNWEGASFSEEQAFKEAMSTPRALKLVAEGFDARSFTLHKGFTK